MNKLLLALSFAFIPYLISAQVIDNTASFRMVDVDRYIRIHYENDYFSGTDEYYTQGVNVEWMAPAFKKNPLNHILILPKAGTHQYGIAVEHNAFTPTSINFNVILYGDRPFAASAVAKAFAVSNHATSRYRITSALSLGFIGKAAGAFEIQRAIHRWIGDTDPKGWQYQVRNDIVINYEAGIEKNIIHSKHFLTNYLTTARLGTLNTKFSAGGTFMLGNLNSAIASVFSGAESAPKQKFTFHLYAQPVINAVVYDATLQGGLVLSRNSPYTLSSKEIERITLQGNAGLVFNIGATYLEYFQSVISKEFETGHTHYWGGVRVGITF